MAFLDLFAGIGGFALGAEWAGMHFDKHYFSEVEPYAIRVYQKRFPYAVALGDIRAIKGSDLPAGDWIIAGGFPCQDISVAGKGAGLQGERSGLWFEYARIIGELRPRYAIMENVGALVSRGLDSVLGSLAEIRYNAEWQDIRASDVGAPHRRERIWIVAYPNGSRLEEHGMLDSVLPVGSSEAGTSTESIETDVAYPDEERRDGAGRAWDGRAESADGDTTIPDANSRRLEVERERGILDCERAALGDDVDGRNCAMANAAQLGCGQGREGRPDSVGEGQTEPALLDTDSQRREKLTNGQPGWPWDADREHGRGRGNWATEPDVGRVAHGISSRVDRLKCLGNSIVPQIAEMIFREIRRHP